MAQWSIDVAIVAEPYRVTPRPDWCGDDDSVVAILLGAKVAVSSRGTIRGRGFVAVNLESFTVVGIYFSPNKPLSDFEEFLSHLTILLSGISHPVIVAGDFNAKSTHWGSRMTDARGRVMVDWLTALGLVVLNSGNVATFWRRRGESIVDITLASETIANRVSNWRVLDQVETLSDHRYIRFDVISRARDNRSPAFIDVRPRWSLRGLDREILKEAAIVASWVPLPAGSGPDEGAEWLNEVMYGICDTSMPRARPNGPRRGAHWWRPETKRLRIECMVARRRYGRYRRRRNRTDDEEERLYDSYRATCHALKESIRNAKTEAWEEWLASLERDPWGRPYKWVRHKLRPAAPPLTQNLDPELRETVLSALFPSRADWSPPRMGPPLDESDDDDVEVPPVTSVELASAVLKMGEKNTAPGLDGIPGRAWVLAMKELEPQVLAVLTSCLVQGRVPHRWKTGKLVLLRKNGKPADQPSAYRPIVLLDEICKVLERVIVARISQHLERVGPNLSPNQFGFRIGRSTIGAIAHLRSIIDDVVPQGGVVLAVSLDIANAFNSLPWATIKEGLRYHRVPKYLRKAIANYLLDRSVQYPTRDGWETKQVVCGVPQGSALGPKLWDIGYDWVLRGDYLPGVDNECYADDTLIVARGRTYRDAVILATAAVAQAVQRIRVLGLTVALEKSEAIVFHGPRKTPPPGLSITVGGTRIDVKPTMTYLGLVLDSRWTFKEHFKRLSEKVSKTAGALSWLLPNLGGPSLSCRRLYLGVIKSMVMYGAPIWSENLRPENRLALGKLQRTMAIRVVRGYRTVSKDAACALAGSIPWDLEASSLAEVYWKCQNERDEGSIPPPDVIKRWRKDVNDRALDLWSERLEQPQVSIDLLSAIRPVLKEWVNRNRGALTFRLTQILTGHGCFGRYLCEIVKREETTACHHCSDTCDTAEHTITTCPAWVTQRTNMTNITGHDTTLPALLRSMLESEEKWRAVEHFAEDVISAKEEAERTREREARLESLRARRPRRRRVVNGDIPP